ncbi:hypothetical protein [Alloactinosynnema sp. L-07]|uniref:hypothetical protein n=1 Tax=Alloactinosynnema sp. L-07 TaxID=1653480 RepID=UPI0012F7E8A2|nr:hypothetical protein [Alloactinosynnema sp. L-07]
MLILTTNRVDDVGRWIPILYRGDGAWLGSMPSGVLGIGIESEGRATLVDADFVPMWPFMERPFVDVLTELISCREAIERNGDLAIDELLESTVLTAWRSGRKYWMDLAARWVEEMKEESRISKDVVIRLRSELRAM